MPRYVFAENVIQGPIDRAADDLEAMGYRCRCVNLSAADLGADHVRERYWLLGHTDHQGELGSEINAEVAVLPRQHTNTWQAEPLGLGVPDGMAAGVDIARATGNGQVPVVAATAWNLLMGSTT